MLNLQIKSNIKITFAVNDFSIIKNENFSLLLLLLLLVCDKFIFSVLLKNYILFHNCLFSFELEINFILSTILYL